MLDLKSEAHLDPFHKAALRHVDWMPARKLPLGVAIVLGAAAWFVVVGALLVLRAVG